MLSEQVFTEYRPLLFTIAYEILGSAVDAEDVVQESFLRWSEVDPTKIENPRAYLVQTVTRQALNHMRGARRRREEYVGSWLPEPVCTAPGADDDSILAESVSMAMLLVLETLTPDERAVFVLGDVFGYSHKEIAAMVDKSDAAVRQIAHRARKHVQSRRPRFRPDAETSQTVVAQFLLAARNGDLEELMNLMSPGVVEITDGGGKVTAARKPVVGREKVARFIFHLARNSMAGFDADLTTCNALPAVRFSADGRLDTVLIFDIDDGLIRGLYAIRNPDKLAHSTTAHTLTRVTGRYADTASTGESL